ncbi:MAG: acyl-CoA dehydratase activase-related protein [Prevotella sp.]|jgi:predicted CoA-substrate-specific enzyme activase|nr:acyl-CoA dehydratase activase-related protein [Prevotella sp.]MCI1282539.1 acyl-CoA dehydratase activase-related protein [Prevotella sp.]
MLKKCYKVGLDVGSTTAKIAVIDDCNEVVFTRYERHNARVGELVSRFFEDIFQQFGDVELNICVTGSVGMSTAEQLQVEFIQEVVAATVFAKSRYPHAKALIDIGGEDAKVVFFHGKNTELRMNGNCAGGTGAFLDQMSVLMGIDNDKMSRLAMQAERIYPMAARCGVFAKTDIQNLMSRNLPESDIAASIFHSVVVQTVTTLSHGCSFDAPILLCGGPLTFLPALRKAFGDYLNLKQEDFIVTPQSNLIPAMGCALRAQGTTIKLSELQKRLNTTQKLVWHSDLKPLFTSEKEHQEWLQAKSAFATDIHPLHEGPMRVVLGIDSGSTTTKIIALDAMQKGDIVFTYYAPNLGNPIHAVRQGLEKLKAEAKARNCDLTIESACSTGYGEELIKAAFNLDEGVIETMAHYRAAASLMPDVSFILDIGGQDMKAIFVENGAVVRMELNEACSSGCGTFIQTFANNLGYSVEDFAQMACTADEPCDLGTRCTVFMNSKVKQVLREGATIADISAGLAYSVVKNCLYKVLKLRGNDTLGGKVVVQGGTMRNDSVVRAFELLTHTTVARNNMPEMMGAYGCALHLLAQPQTSNISVPRTLDDLLKCAEYETKMLQCKGCENHCFVSMYTFQGGRKFYSGNKCERVFNNKGNITEKGENIYVYKDQRIFRPSAVIPKAGARKIGIPRILNMYEDYPFWNTLLTYAGFEVVLSAESNFHRYESALGSVMSDNICFPAKLVHSHIAELDKMGLERILMPYVVYEHKEDNRTINSYNCPIVSAYSDVIKSAMEPKTPIDAPVINFSNIKLLRKQINDYLHGLGVSKSLIKKAFEAALDAQEAYTQDIQAKAEEILAKSRREGKLTILLAGRPYHTDPIVQHKLSDMVASLGVNVISDDIVRRNQQTDSGETYLVKQWAYMNRIIKSGQWAAEQGDDLHFVQMTSFGCGPDAFIQDEIRDILKRHGKPFTLLKIDDVSNIGSLKLRVRSLIESLKAKNEASKESPVKAFETTKVYQNEDRKRKILAPYFTEYLTPILPPVLDLIGYDLEVLPESDEESARLGLEYANNEICYPATLIVGDIIKALQSGRYDLKNTTVVMSQTGGQCRATNYAGLIKRAMIATGFKDVPLITLGVATNANGENEQEGFDIPWVKYSKIIVTSLLYGDTISKMYHAAVVREAAPGLAASLRDKFMKAADHRIRRNDAAGLMDLISSAATEFDAISLEKDVPKVGIVGEIFLKFNPFAHQYLAKTIISKGIEVVPPLLSPFFLQEFVNVIVQKQMRLSCSRVPDIVVKGIYDAIRRRMRKINKTASKFRYFRPFTDIFEDAKAVNGTVSLAAQFGEGWLLPSDIIGLIRDGVKNVVSLQPFGCIANHVVSKGIEKRLHRDYPDLNLVSLDFDSGVSAVNVANRLLLFLDNIAV